MTHQTTYTASCTASQRPAHREAGFSLVELMVAMGLGLLLTTAMAYVYLSSKTAFSRQQQLSSIQQSVRIAFEYLGSDTRMVGHMGCFTGKATTAPDFVIDSTLLATSVGTNYAFGIDGYEYKNTAANAYTIASNAPNDEIAASNWETNTASNGIKPLVVADIAGTGNGLTPGSDVLVIRTVAGRPVRLAADTPISNAASLSLENMAGGTCSDGTAKVSGFCANSHGLVASCSRARVFKVDSIAAQTLTMHTALGTNEQYTMDAAEVFPMQTIVYYVKKASSGNAPALYRRTFDGDNANGLEQELIEGVEGLHVRYGIDSTTPEPDGVVDSYVTAQNVTDWSKVVAVRMGLLIRSTLPVEADVTLPLTGLVNGVTVTYPTTGTKYDRRVFTTTVAVRNKISYF